MKELKINVPKGYEIDKDKSTFEKIVFKKKNELPESWENLESIEGYWVGSNCEIIPLNSGGAFFVNKNVFKTKEQAQASLALARLSQLRHVYRQGWEPDWELYSAKYCVVFVGDNLTVHVHSYDANFLSFKDRKTAEMFLENFRDLIEQAKPLML